MISEEQLKTSKPVESLGSVDMSNCGSNESNQNNSERKFRDYLSDEGENMQIKTCHFQVFV
jgi:hypothetical protein